MQGVTSDVKEKETGAYEVNITMEGGSGKAHILSPVTITVKEGESYATLVWSSENYDYIIVDGVKYENERHLQRKRSGRDVQPCRDFRKIIYSKGAAARHKV